MAAAPSSSETSARPHPAPLSGLLRPRPRSAARAAAPPSCPRPRLHRPAGPPLTSAAAPLSGRRRSRRPGCADSAPRPPPSPAAPPPCLAAGLSAWRRPRLLLHARWRALSRRRRRRRGACGGFAAGDSGPRELPQEKGESHAFAPTGTHGRRNGGQIEGEVRRERQGGLLAPQRRSNDWGTATAKSPPSLRPPPEVETEGCGQRGPASPWPRTRSENGLSRRRIGEGSADLTSPAVQGRCCRTGGAASVQERAELGAGRRRRAPEGGGRKGAQRGRQGTARGKRRRGRAVGEGAGGRGPRPSSRPQ